MWHAVRAYFRANQTSTVHFGSKFPDSPFLAGFYGGTFSPGVFETDAMIFEKLTAAGFRPQPSVDILRLALTNFKPPVERRIIIAKRNYELRVSPDPPPESWWENNLAAFRHQLDFRMLHRKSNRPCGLVSFCNSRPQDAGWDSRYFGMRRIRVDDDLQRSGLGQAMLLDALKDLCQRGVVEIEAQVPRDNIACQSMLKKVGFCPVASATQMQLALDGP
jgi:GNAT superfamily N-acetyltransferase